MAAAKPKVPQQKDLLNPTLQALRNRGGSATNEEIHDEVVRIMGLPDDVVNESHLGSITQTELQYRLAWTRNRLKHVDIVQNSGRGVWSLTKRGQQTSTLDPTDVERQLRAQRHAAHDGSSEEDDAQESAWQTELLDTIRSLGPSDFEHLCQFVLRESGFSRVEVTGRTGDGGIDGTGVLRLSRLISFPIVFQCKRYANNIGAPAIRDFRGAMEGRADRGLVITTAGFTVEAQREASRDGAKPIDLVDGRQLAALMKDLRLGLEVQEQVVEHVRVDKPWFDQF